MSALRAVALSAVVAGGVGSLVAMRLVGRSAPIFLLLVFAGWILSPSVALVFADRKATAWPAATRVTLYILMIVLAVGSAALYADVVLRPPASTPAARFVLVPLASFLLMGIVIPLAAFLSRR